VALLVATAVFAGSSGDNPVVLRIVDRVTEEPLAGAQVDIGGRALVADSAGKVKMERPTGAATVAVRLAGFDPMFGQIDAGIDSNQQVALRPNTIAGVATDAATGAPIAGATLRAMGPRGEAAVATTDAAGAFRLAEVPTGAVVRIDAGDHGTAEQPVADGAAVNFALTVSVVTGRVTDAAGSPLAGAVVRAPGGAEIATGADGAFRLTGAGGATELTVAAPGFDDAVVPVGADLEASAQLQRQSIKAVYANYSTIADPARLGELIRLADETEINAIVIDVKQDTIYYDSQVPFFRDIEGVVNPIFDPAELLAQMADHGIYTIARMVVFKDPLVAEGRPDLSVTNEDSGGLWRDDNGSAWVNAFNEELWAANAALAAELAGLGFDEIQYDYIRFPSDGDLTVADFGPDYSEAARRAAITGAVRAGSDAVRPTGAKFAIDLFAIVALFGDDQGIGQTLQDLTPLADYVCLMVYPSHYSVGNVPVDGHPNDFPGETVTYTLEQAELLVPGSRLKMRPWLQDFTQPLDGFSEYGPNEVRAQIEATEALGASGWMLWDASGQFEEAALAPE